MHSFSSNDIFPEEKPGNLNFPLSDPLNTHQIIGVESRKTKKMFIFGVILTNLQQTAFEANGKIFLKKLKFILDAKNRLKLGFDKCHKIIKGIELEDKKAFFSQFLSQFATRKKLFDFTCYQKINVSRFAAQKNDLSTILNTPKKRFKRCYKLYKDQLHETTNFKQKLIGQRDFEFFLAKQNACISISLILRPHEKKNLRLGFKRILVKALSTVTPNEMTGFKGFSKYSIILLPFKGIL